MQRCLLFIILSLITSWSFAQTVRLFPMEESSLLWKIEGNGMNSESYLFGTIHLIEKEHFYFPKKLEKLIQKSDQVVLEIAMDASEESQTELLNHLQLKEGSLFDFFTLEQTDSILAWAEKELNLLPQQFQLVMNKMKPFVVVQMATQLEMTSETVAYEIEIQKIANKQQIQLLGLETVGIQIGFFDQLDSLDQTEMVMSIIRDPSKNDSISQLMQELYLSQQIDKLYSFISSTPGMTEHFQTLLVTNRNEKWINPIQQMISEDNTFIAVGAGHLGGPKGLVRLLEMKGYTLTPVKL